MTISSSKNLLSAIQAGNKLALNIHLSKFKERGVVSFDKVLSIQSSERIPALAKNEDMRYEILIALSASLKSAFNNMNLKMSMNEDQIIDLADCIIDQSEQDNLSIEDVLLFLQKLLTGETVTEYKKGKVEGRIFDRMDIPKFFELFETYRQERHESLLRIKEEQSAQFKIVGREDGAKRMTRDEDPRTFFELYETINNERPDSADCND